MQTTFSIIKTSQSVAREPMTFSGGSIRIKTVINFSAVLVRHGEDTLLFDSGLGCEVDAQYNADMPVWKRPLLPYGPVDPVKMQLARSGLSDPSRIVLSHSHWDHASGLVDFPDADVWTTKSERAFMGERHSCLSIKAGASMPSQISSPTIRWHEFEFENAPYENFSQSLDLYGDGAVVLVPLVGHTPGSMGMFVTVESGRRVFFCGDAVWNAKAIAKARPKMFFARLMVDDDATLAQCSIELLRDLKKARPETTIVPAHDGAVQDTIGYFPDFVS